MSHDWVDGKTILGDHNVHALAKKGVCDELNDLVGAVSENQLVGIRGVARPWCCADEGVTVWVKVGLGGRFHGSIALGEGQRDFVGSEFNEPVQGRPSSRATSLEAAGLIDRQVGQLRVELH